MKSKTIYKMKRKQIVKREKFGFVEMIMILRRKSGRMENKKEGIRTKFDKYN